MGFLHETCFLFFFFLGKHEDFPKREFCGNFVEKSRNPIMTFDYVCTKRWKEGKQSS